MARIDLVDLAHSYGGNDAPPESFALKPVTMTWRQGGAYALLGPSGCGKTTLLRLVAGFEAPNSGVMSVPSNRIFPRDGVTMPEIRLSSVVLPQPDGPSSA